MRSSHPKDESREGLLQGNAEAEEIASKNANDEKGEGDEVKQTPLPMKRVALIGLILFANTFNILVIFPFLPWMVRDFFPELSDTELGFEAGYLASAFHLGSFFGSIMWGRLADKYGRRPILLIGIVGNFI